MIPKTTARFFLFFFKAYPGRSVLVVLLLALAGLAEGLSVTALIPILELAEGSGEAPSGVGQLIVQGLEFVGLEATLLTLLGLIVTVMTLKAAMLWLAMREVGYTLARVTRDLRLRLIRSLLAARWRYFSRQTSGSFANTISSEAIRAAAAYREACVVISAVFQILAYLLVSVVISWQITVFALVSGVFLLIMLQRFVAMGRAAGEEQTKLIRSLTGRLVEVVQGIKPVKAMAKEEMLLPLLEQETEGLNEAHRKDVLALESLSFFQQPILTLLLAVALFALIEVGGQPLSSVLILAFIFYRLMQHVNTLQMRFQIMVGGESAFWSMHDQIAEAEAESEGIADSADKDARPLEDAVRFEKVSFAYEPARPVLRDVTFEIPAGAFLTIAGESGSGKTTLADLLVRLHVPDGGRIFADGMPLDEISLRAWRRQIGYVPQDPLLFNDTILANVTLGDPSLSREDAERALGLADAWKFVAERPGALEFKAGERGGMLSGGQRQRIAIARALVHRPSILVLDEVTTALDPQTEQAICETLRGLRGTVTILSISHQPAMRSAADTAYFLRAGVLERATAVLG